MLFTDNYKNKNVSEQNAHSPDIVFFLQNIAFNASPSKEQRKNQSTGSYPLITPLNASYTSKSLDMKATSTFVPKFLGLPEDHMCQL